MWECTLCLTKNNDSSLKCHGKDCVGEIPPELLGKNDDSRVLDWCPVCNSEQTFTKEGIKKFRRVWRCTKCHKDFHKYGKYKPKKKSYDSTDISSKA